MRERAEVTIAGDVGGREARRVSPVWTSTGRSDSRVSPIDEPGCEGIVARAAIIGALMPLDLLLLVVGLVALVWSADEFVLGSSRLAGLLALPPVVIGAVVMGFGTSAPELIVSSVAAAGGDRELGIGNIVGSNVANLTLVLGTAAFVTRMSIPDEVFRREGPLSIGAGVLFAAFVVDGELSRVEGIVLVTGLVVVIATLIRGGLTDVFDDEDDVSTDLGRESARVAVGLVGTVLGAQFVVWGATGVADELGVTGGFIGFSLVALGTSLPELVTCVACARREETELIVGNLFGSNIFNALAVGGGMGLVGPGIIDDPTLTGTGLVLMLAVAVGSFALGAYGRYVGRPDGVLLLASYVTIMLVLGSSASDDDEEDDALGMVAADTASIDV